MVDMRYSEDHMWVRLEDDGTVLVGITDALAERLGEIGHIELPEVGSALAAGDEIATVECDEGESEIFSPVTGTISEVNPLVEDEPSVLSDSPFDDGWLLRFEVEDVDMEALEDLMDEEAYQDFLGED